MKREIGSVEKDSDNTCPAGVIIFLPLMVIAMAICLFVGLAVHFKG